MREQLLDRLAASGALVKTEGTILGFIPRTTWPTSDPAREDDVRRRLQAALVDGTTPTERTVALIALLQVTGLLTKVVTTTENKRALKAKAKELTSGDWAAAAVKAAIDEAAAATMAAVGAASAGAAGSS